MMHRCPKCSRALQQERTIDYDGEMLAVYRCHDCIAYWRVAGMQYTTTLTFAVSATGSLFDPDAPHKPFAA